MEDFEAIYETGGTFPDYLKCKHCGERVERGVVSVSNHWMNCLERTKGIIVAKSEFEKQILDSCSINGLDKHSCELKNKNHDNK